MRNLKDVLKKAATVGLAALLLTNTFPAAAFAAATDGADPAIVLDTEPAEASDEALSEGNEEVGEGEAAEAETEDGRTDGGGGAEETAAEKTPPAAEDNDGEEASDINGDTSAEQVDVLPKMEANSLTENIVGEVLTEAFNNMQESNQTGDDSKNNDPDEYPIDPHDRSYYGDSSRVRELDNGNYLVYRDSYLLISQEDRANYAVTYSEDHRTAYVSPAFSEADLEGKTGIIFLSDSLGNDEILVFGGDPHYEDDKLVVPLAATEDIPVRRLFSDGKLHYSLNHDIPIINWNNDLSGTNWSGTITDHDIQDISFDVDFDIWAGAFALAVYLDFSIDFDITTTGASGGREAVEAASIAIPVEDLFSADVIFNVEAEFDEKPIHVKGSLLTNFEYSFSVTTGTEIKKFRTPVTISEFTVVNPEDYNKDINFYLGSELISRLGVIEIDLIIYKIGPILSLDQDSEGGCYITARHEKDQYDKPDPTKEEIHICAQNGKDGCLSLLVEEKNKVSLNIVIDFSPLFDPWTFPFYTDETLVDTTQYYDSYTFNSGMQEGICPHKGFRIDVEVDTTKGTSTEGAAVSYTPVSEGFEPLASAVADQNGKAVLFAPANEQIQVKAELASRHDPDWKISGTETLDKTAEVQDLKIILEIPEKHVYFKNPVSGTASNWPEDITFAPFLSEHVRLSGETPVLSGYQFTEWNTKQDGSGTSYAPGTELELDDDLTLWAQWVKAEKSWFVVYNANGGKNAPKPQIVPQGQDAVLSSQKPEAGTMIFRGWALSENAPEPDYQPEDTLPYDENKNVVVLYALWEIDPVERPIHITYDANGMEGADLPADVWIQYGSWLQLRAAIAPAGSGYVFKGWSKDKDAKDPEYKAGNTYFFSEDTTLYAIWEKQDTVTLTFRDSLPDSASGIPDPITINPTMSRDVRIPGQIPQKSGRQFIGWNTAQDGSGTDYAPDSVFTLLVDSTLWAKWDTAGNSWYVIYNANGGKNAPAPQIVPQGQDAVLSSQKPEAGTMVFRGWALSENAPEPDYQPESTLPYDENKNVVVLYALWYIDPVERPIHITYDANGMEGADLPADVWIQYKSWLQLKAAIAPAGSGYVFKGWSKDKDAKDPEYKAGNTYFFSEDTALYAIWEKQETVTLTFRDSLPDSASGIPDPITINPTMSRDVRIPGQIPQKSGRQFIGWNTAQDGSGTDYAPGSVFTLLVDSTLWAKWDTAGNSWYVIYNANGGKNAPTPQIVPQGQDAVLSSQKPEAGTLIFRGWALSENAPEPDYQPEGTLPYDENKNVVVLYALWSLDPAPRPITIVFDANGGKPDTVPEKITAPKDTSVQIPSEKPSWDSEHDFLGWSADPKAKAPQWVPGATTTFGEDMTLYAVWKVKTHTITYKLNGGTYRGSGKDITETHEFGSIITIHAAPKREGYTFLYWKGSQYQPGDTYTVSGDHSFTAQWEKKSDPQPTPQPDDPSGGSGNTPSAKTGDNSNITLWLALMIASLSALAAAIYRQRRVWKK